MSWQSVEEIERNLIFQDYMLRKFYKQGIPLNLYSSKKYNVERGEGIGRAEIKHDMKFRNTGNLYIETHEKQSPSSPKWIESGINRNDNTLFYIIGDERDVWWFNKIHLKEICKKENFKKVGNETSKGILLPISYIRKNKVAIHFKFKEE